MMIALSEPGPKLRRPRFSRRSLKTNVVITERDLDIFSYLMLCRFLRGDQIAGLVLPDAAPCAGCAGTGRVVVDGATSHHQQCRGTGRQGHKTLMERIGDLWEAGYLERPPLQYDYWRPGGSQRLVYALGNDGVRALIKHGSIEQIAHIDHSARAIAASKKFILHSLAQADLAVALMLAVRRHMSVRLVQTRALVAELPAKTAALDFPFKLTAPVRLGGETAEASVIPDWPFALEFPSSRPGRSTAVRAYLAELDRGTEPITRSTFNQTSLLKKCLVYQAAAAHGVAERRLGWPLFRVPIITTSTARAEALIAALRAHPELRRSLLFIVSTHDQIAAATDIMTMPWLTVAGDPYTPLPDRIAAV